VVEFPLNVYAVNVQLLPLFQRIKEFKHTKIIKIIVKEHELGCICKKLFQNVICGQIDPFLMI
jgi:hypothetical protein